MSRQRNSLKRYSAGGLASLARKALSDPAFREWFSGSRVVDKEGLPLIVYRGEYGPSTNELQTRRGSISFGSRDAANTYAMDPNDYHATAEAPRILPSYLSMQRPVIENHDDPFIDAEQLARAVGRSSTKDIVDKLAGRFEGTGRWQEELNAHYDYRSPLDFLEKNPRRWSELYADAYPVFDDPELVRLFQSKGYDGAIHMGNGETALEDEYKVFDPSQVLPVFDQARDDVIHRLSTARRKLRGYDVGGAVKAVRNFLTGVRGSGIDAALNDLKMAPRQARSDEQIDAMNRWIDRNLKNYIIKQHGTPDDPLRHVLGDQYQSAITKRSAAEHYAGEYVPMNHGYAPSEDATLPEPMEEAPPWFMKLVQKDWPRWNDERAHSKDIADIGYANGQDALKQKLEEIDAKHTLRNTPPVELYDVGGGNWSAGPHPLRNTLSDTLDYLRTLDPRSLPQVSVPDAVRKSREWHAAMEKRKAEANAELIGKLPVAKQYQDGSRWVEMGIAPEERNSDMASGVSQAAQSIGKALGHCYQDPATCESYLNSSKLYTLIDKAGKPRVTVEVTHPDGDINVSSARYGNYGPELAQAANRWDQLYKTSKDGNLPTFPEFVQKNYADALNDYKNTARIDQIRGPQNGKAPEDALPYLKDFIGSRPFASVEGARDYGLEKFTTQGGYPRWLEPESIPPEFARYRYYDPAGQELLPADTFLRRMAEDKVKRTLGARAAGPGGQRAIEAARPSVEAQMRKELEQGVMPPASYSIPDDWMPPGMAGGGVVDSLKVLGGDLLDRVKSLKRELADIDVGDEMYHRLAKRNELRRSARSEQALEDARKKVADNLVRFGIAKSPKHARNWVGQALESSDPVQDISDLTTTGIETGHKAVHGNELYDEIVKGAEEHNDLPDGLLQRLIARESGFDPNAKSDAGALGIAQFMPATAAELGIDPLDPKQAIPAAGGYLKRLHDKLGSWRDAVAAYNWGMGNVLKYGYTHAPAETRAYVQAVFGPDDAARAIARAKRTLAGKQSLAQAPLLPRPISLPEQAATIPQSQDVPREAIRSVANRLTPPPTSSRLLRELDPDQALDLLIALGGDDEEERDGLLELLAQMEGDGVEEPQ